MRSMFEPWRSEAGQVTPLSTAEVIRVEPGVSCGLVPRCVKTCQAGNKPNPRPAITRRMNPCRCRGRGCPPPRAGPRARSHSGARDAREADVAGGHRRAADREEGSNDSRHGQMDGCICSEGIRFLEAEARPRRSSQRSPRVELRRKLPANITGESREKRRGRRRQPLLR
jgi:hypothetical protein